MNLAQFSLSMLLMAVITAITVYHVAKIYKFAILNNGS